MDGASASLRARLASHCLLLETRDSLVLIDTGYGLRDIAQPRSRLNPIFLALMKPELREEMSAVRQIEALGFRARDVRHIVLSHLDFDHAGGLDDFPDATEIGGSGCTISSVYASSPTLTETSRYFAPTTCVSSNA
jgi:glyoxylase-like metal-dependent hydrolase (beta-lactamase superfamily II)